MAVYTHIKEDELLRYLLEFDIGALTSFTGITDGIENTNYLLVTERAKFILTLFEKRVNAKDLPFYISFMEHLHAAGIPCPQPVPDGFGRNIGTLAGKNALITTFLYGEWPKEISNAHISAMGAMLARLHRAAEGFAMTRENTMALPAWRHLIASCGARADDVVPGLAALLEKELSYLEAHMPEGLPSGAVHADLFPDNVFFREDVLTGVIDFYFSCTDSFAYDLMLTANAWCGTDRDKFALLLESYQQGRALSAEEKKALPLLGRAAALRIIATRLYDLLHPVTGALVRPKDPMEYVRILQSWQEAA